MIEHGDSPPSLDRPTRSEADRSEPNSDGRSDLAPWAQTWQAVAHELGVDVEEGLTEDEAGIRLVRHGANELRSATVVPVWRRLLAQVNDPVVYLLLVATAISLVAWWIEGASGPPLDATVIVLIIVVNALVGHLQERRAEHALAALRDLTQAEAAVVRGGLLRRLPAADLVPGDVLELRAGDVVPADARLVRSERLQVAEAALTGESLPVAKAVAAVPTSSLVGDRTSIAHSGTAVVSGHARAVVTATGHSSEMGRIAALLDDTKIRPTPLRQEIDWVGRVLGSLVVVIAVVVVATLVALGGWRTSAGVIESLLIGVSLAVAAVPEGLPAVLTVVLALGVQRLARRNALVKRLSSVETLGSATVICSDKTGTLTRNEMAVRQVVVAGGGFAPERIGPDGRWALYLGGLASTGPTHNGSALGGSDPTESAILLAASAAPHAEAGDMRRLAELPFTSERKLMSTVSVESGKPNRVLVAMKGAPDVVLPRCRTEYRDGRAVPLDARRRRWWTSTVDSMADEALRTLAIAYRWIDCEIGSINDDPVGSKSFDVHDADALEQDLVLVAVLGIIDPPRPEAATAIATARRAGIKVVMITGDHPITAHRIAAELGIAGDEHPVVTGTELMTVAEPELVDLSRKTSVYARVAPEQKLDIVKAMLADGETVAMTGDGVNDAPALKAADIGIAMGLTGTDVSKEAADMILADDDFATIVAAVSEGRTIFHNIRSFLRYLLSSNTGEVLTVFGGVIAATLIGLDGVSGSGPVPPLLAVQILWINLVTDAGPALALGVDPPTPGLMDRRPRQRSERVIDHRMRQGIALVGLTMAVATLAMLDLRLAGGLLGGTGDLTEARTAAFTVLVLSQLFNALNARSDTQSGLTQVFSNRWLLAAIGLSLALQIAVVQIPVFHQPFGTTALSLADWMIAAGFASSVLWVGEARKWVLRRTTPVDQLD